MPRKSFIKYFKCLGIHVLAILPLAGCPASFTSPDREWPPNLAKSRDLAQSGDMASSGDLTPAPDLTPPPDLMPPPDLQPEPDLSVPPTFEDDWTGIVGTGQSLSIGVGGFPTLTDPHLYGNLKLDDPSFDGDYNCAGHEDTKLVPLAEPIRGYNDAFPDSYYPNNIKGQTPHTAMGNQLSFLSQSQFGRGYRTVHTVAGVDGQSIEVIRKGGSSGAYESSVYETRAISALATKDQRRFSVGAIILTHGESDAYSATYEADIRQLFTDYNADLRAITGQNRTIPLFLTQQGTFPTTVEPGNSTLAQWHLGLDYPGEIICVGPKYQYEYIDGIHMTSPAYRGLGEKYAEAYFQTVVLKQPWVPLQPRSVVRGRSSLIVEFAVPVPPLRWDDSIPVPHQTAHLEWAAGRGFEVSTAQGPLTIRSVDIISPTAVQIRLDSLPAEPVMLGYAVTQDLEGFYGGRPGGRLGQLRDSDPFIGLDADILPCLVTRNSAVVRFDSAPVPDPNIDPPDFSTRGLRDVVLGSDLDLDTVVLERNPDDPKEITLSSPWHGPSGLAMLGFHHNQWNYAVQFLLTVP